MVVLNLIFAVAISLHVVWCQPDTGRLLQKNPTDNSLLGNVGIIGGHKIHIEQVPFMASLRLNGSFHFCGGSIIHERFILTAAHCIIPNREFKILVGTDKISGEGELYDIEEIIVHRKYNNRTQDFDFCLIKLKNPLTFGPKVAKINLTKVKVRPGDKMNVTGWGSTGPDNAISFNLMQVQVPLISWFDCSRQYLKQCIITSHMLCAGNRGHDSCQGDSGGPLTIGDTQVGVTSFGLQCGATTPGVYAKVSSVRNWIMKKIQNL